MKAITLHYVDDVVIYLYFDVICSVFNVYFVSVLVFGLPIDLALNDVLLCGAGDSAEIDDTLYCS